MRSLLRFFLQTLAYQVLSIESLMPLGEPLLTWRGFWFALLICPDSYRSLDVTLEFLYVGIRAVVVVVAAAAAAVAAAR